MRCVTEPERKAKLAQIKADWERLTKNQINLSSSEAEYLKGLEEIFGPKQNSFLASEWTRTEPAKKFKDQFADPKTGYFPKAVVEIDIPTGELVFANSLFKYLKDFPKEELYSRENSVNHTSGRNRNIAFHAKENNAFYVPIGNDCPNVWQHKTKPSKLRVGIARDEAKAGEWSYQQANKNWEECGNICTDLWAFHAVDRSQLPDKIDVTHFIVKVPPGRYRLTNHYEHEGCKTGIFCEIERTK